MLTCGWQRLAVPAVDLAVDFEQRRGCPRTPLTATGVMSMLGTGLYTAVFAVLQYAGVRRLA